MNTKTTFVWGTPLPLPPDNPPLGYKLDLDTTHPYLKTRRLHAQTILDFDLGFCATAPLKGRIAIPVHDAKGSLVGYAGRWPGTPPPKRSKYKFVCGGYLGNELFNLHRVLKEGYTDPIILVSGFFDVMHLWELGWHNVLAIMDGELRSAQAARLVHHFPNRRIIALFDETDYGRAARERALTLLAPRAFVSAMQFQTPNRSVESLTATELEEL